MFISNQSRGTRNNNPLNIRRSSSQWKGLVEVPTDDRFCQFKTLAYGWRAAFHLLTRTYYGKYGHNTIRSVISKWAPPCFKAGRCCRRRTCRTFLVLWLVRE